MSGPTATRVLRGLAGAVEAWWDDGSDGDNNEMAGTILDDVLGQIEGEYESEYLRALADGIDRRDAVLRAIDTAFAGYDSDTPVIGRIIALGHITEALGLPTTATVGDLRRALGALVETNDAPAERPAPAPQPAPTTARTLTSDDLARFMSQAGTSTKDVVRAICEAAGVTLTHDDMWRARIPGVVGAAAAAPDGVLAHLVRALATDVQHLLKSRNAWQQRAREQNVPSAVTRVREVHAVLDAATDPTSRALAHLLADALAELGG